VLDAEAVTRECFSEAFSSPHPDLEDFKITLLSYSKDGEPKWARDKNGGYTPDLPFYLVLTGKKRYVARRVSEVLHYRRRPE
jgi:hypothetical protein